MPLQGSGGPFELRAGNPKRTTTKGLTGSLLFTCLNGGCGLPRFAGRVAVLGKGGMWSQSGRRRHSRWIHPAEGGELVRSAANSPPRSGPPGTAARLWRCIGGDAGRVHCARRGIAKRLWVCLLLGGAYCECSMAPPGSLVADPRM